MTPKKYGPVNCNVARRRNSQPCPGMCERCAISNGYDSLSSAEHARGCLFYDYVPGTGFQAKPELQVAERMPGIDTNAGEQVKPRLTRVQRAKLVDYIADIAVRTKPPSEIALNILADEILYIIDNP